MGRQNGGIVYHFCDTEPHSRDAAPRPKPSGGYPSYMSWRPQLVGYAVGRERRHRRPGRPPRSRAAWRSDAVFFSSVATW